MIENTSSPTSKKRILVVDDERDITESIKSALKDRYWVDTAGSALDGLRCYKPHFYDLILLDFRMHPKQKVCFITAYKGLDKRMTNLQWRNTVNSVFHEDVHIPNAKEAI